MVVTAWRDGLAALREGGLDGVAIDAYDPAAWVLELADGLGALPEAPPVVLISGSPAAPEISARIGAAAFLVKPCEPPELVAAIERAIGAPPPLIAPLEAPLEIDDEPTGPLR